MNIKKILLTTLVLSSSVLAFTGLTSCGGKNPVESLKLKHEFKGKDFMDDGIQEVDIDRISDGDTATFDGYTVRFNGVNTPESTGQIEKWGKAASNFTKEKLKSAKSVVIEGTEGIGNAPVTEGTGGRYKAYVWYMPEGGDRYYNLNCELLYNGFADNSITEESPYFKYFNDAYDYAAKKGLNMHSDNPDPLYDETLEVMDLKTIIANPQKYDQNYVQIEAYIVSSSSKSNEITIAQVIEGKEYKFDIYLGYENFPNEIIRVGNKVKFVARVNSHYDKWQLSGLEYNLSDSNTSRVITEGYICTFGGIQDMNYGYDAIKVTNIAKDGDFVIVTGKTSNLRVKDVNVTIKVPASAATSIKVGGFLSCTAYSTTQEGHKPDAKDISLKVLNAKDIK